MDNLNRFVIKIAGSSGQGIDSAGRILAKTIKNSGYNLFAYREYPSLIKGGYSCYQIDFGDQEISSSSAECDVLISLDRKSTHVYLPTVREGGLVIHNIDRLAFTEQETQVMLNKGLHVEYIDSNPLMDQLGSRIFTNIFFLGLLCQVTGLNTDALKDLVREEYADKPDLVELDIKAIDMGCEYQTPGLQKRNLSFKQTADWKTSLLVSGNEAIALGAVSGGVRMYVGYPMTPASSILSYLSSTYHQTGMLIKQAEDEITAAQIALGAMFTGTRAMTGTSGGGFDLMAETISLAGMTETPFVCVLGQRPGPATGVPTWTAAGDLNLAIHAAHGEFPRCVIAASDAESAYVVTQQALNIAEEFQMPVFVLTEKQIAESLFNIDKLPDAIPIRRGLVPAGELKKLKPQERFEVTESGVSKRWLPGQSAATYLGNSDEHLEDGTLTEEAEPVQKMMDKRMRKLETLRSQIPEPVLYGDPNADTVVVSWGSVKNTVTDALRLIEKPIAYLHYEYIWPFKTKKIEQLIEQGRDLVLIENNYQGQLGELIRQQTGYKFPEQNRLLKYDGRPFFIEDILEYFKQ